MLPIFFNYMYLIGIEGEFMKGPRNVVYATYMST